MKRFFGALRSKALMYGKNGFWFILDGVLINSAIILTTGAFLAGFFVYLNAPDFIVGIVNTAHVWTTLFALASCFVFNRVKKTKRFLIILNVLARTMICSIAALPHIIGHGGLTIYVAAFLVIGGNIVWSIYAVGGNIWLMATIPRTERSAFIYLRFLWLRVSFALTAIVMGFVLDAFNGSLAGFGVVFSVSFVLSFADILTLLKIPYTSGKERGVNTMTPSLLTAPFRNSQFRNFLAFLLLFNLFLYASASFTSLYLIKYMGFSYKYISTATVLSHIMLIVSTVFWGNFERKKGAIMTIKVTAAIVCLEQFAYAFQFRGNIITPFIAAFCMGLGNGGLNIIFFNFRYSIMPEDNVTNYETWFMVVQGLGIALGPVVGNYIKMAFAFALSGVSVITEFQALYLVASVAAFTIVMLFVGKKLTRKA